MNSGDTIAAPSTAPGGALGVIRLSGPRAVEICAEVFRGRTDLLQADANTTHYGRIMKGSEVIDEIVVSLFLAPHSYTGEDVVEISYHGSPYIERSIMALLLAHGARLAEAGEFTVRAFLAGKLDLVQAEAVADMIASRDRASHSIAIRQMRGGYSAELAELRSRLLHLTSLLELELDFSEEEVEFADRTQLLQLIDSIMDKLGRLIESFRVGNAIKEGVGVAIVGAPNVGKSTLLNTLLKEDRAMVSDIAGTTRDSIEESVVIGGISFRFVDTAGIRSTSDTLESMGIERSKAAIERAQIVLLIVEDSADEKQLQERILESLGDIEIRPDQKVYIVANKSDKLPQSNTVCKTSSPEGYPIIEISAKTGHNIQRLTDHLTSTVNEDMVYGEAAVVSNLRHYEAMQNAWESLSQALDNLQSGLPADLLSQSIREAIHHIGTITGEITTDEILGSIFSNFCIGK